MFISSIFMLPVTLAPSLENNSYRYTPISIKVASVMHDA